MVKEHEELLLYKLGVMGTNKLPEGIHTVV